MESFSFILKFAVVAFVFVGILIAIPYMLVKFSQPTWAITKTILEFIIVGSVLSAIFSQMNEPIAGIVIALIFAVFRHRSRVAKYAKLNTQPNIENN
jgi:ABC-type iron transport system FetAB permease component